MLLTMPAYRTDAAKDSEIRFLETPAGAPRAINAWWYVGDNTGYQFMYSKQQLAELNRIGQPEPVAAAAEESPNLAEGEPVVPPISEPDAPGVVEGDGVPPEASADADVAADVEQEEAELQAQAQPPAQQPPFENEASSSASSRDTLPRTASPLGLILLTGLATGGLGVLLRKL
jgi:hypothetical protein